MMTWYWPPAWTTVTTPSSSLMLSVAALDSSLRTKRIRVAQCDIEEMLASPPTCSSRRGASAA